MSERQGPEKCVVCGTYSTRCFGVAQLDWSAGTAPVCLPCYVRVLKEPQLERKVRTIRTTQTATGVA